MYNHRVVFMASDYTYLGSFIKCIQEVKCIFIGKEVHDAKLFKRSIRGKMPTFLSSLQKKRIRTSDKKIVCFFPIVGTIFKYLGPWYEISNRSKVVSAQSFSYLTTKTDRPVFLSNTNGLQYLGKSYVSVCNRFP